MCPRKARPWLSVLWAGHEAVIKPRMDSVIPGGIFSHPGIPWILQPPGGALGRGGTGPCGRGGALWPRLSLVPPISWAGGGAAMAAPSGERGWGRETRCGTLGLSRADTPGGLLGRTREQALPSLTVPQVSQAGARELRAKIPAGSTHPFILPRFWALRDRRAVFWMREG